MSSTAPSNWEWPTPPVKNPTGSALEVLSDFVGGGEGPLEAIVEGASVFIVTREGVLVDHVCGGTIKDDRICFVSASECGVNSHALKKSTNLPIGVYIKAPSTAHSARVVYADPVGQIDILKKFVDFIMTYPSAKKSEWAHIFQVLEKNPHFEDAMKELNISTTPLQGKKLSFKINTPRSEEASSKESPLSIATQPMSPSVIPKKREATEFSAALPNALRAKLDKETQVHTTLQLWDGLITQAYDEMGSLSSEEAENMLSATEVGMSLYNMATNCVTLIQELADMMETEKGSNIDAFKGVDFHLSDLHTKLTVPKGMEDLPGNTIWECINAIHGDMLKIPDPVEFTSLKATMREVKDRFSTLHDSAKAWSDGYDEALSDIKKQLVTPLSDKEISGIINKVQQQMSPNLMKEVAKEAERTAKIAISNFENSNSSDTYDNITERMITLEKQLLTTQASYPYDTDRIITGPEDIVCLWQEVPHISPGFGGIVDVHSILQRIHLLISKGSTPAELVSAIAKAKSLNLSMDEGLVMTSHTSMSPALFNADPILGVTEIGSLKKMADLRNRAKSSGVADRTEEVLPIASREVKAVIQKQFPGRELAPMRAMAIDMLNTSIQFLRNLFAWAEDTHLALSGGGNTEKDSWWLITFVMRSLFTKYLAPARVCAHRNHFASDAERAAEFTWSAIKSYNAILEIEEIGIQDHPMVMGAFSEWLVQNSGRKEATEAKAEVASMKEEIAELKQMLKDQQKALNEAQQAAKGAKSVADKAWNKAKGKSE